MSKFFHALSLRGATSDVAISAIEIATLHSVALAMTVVCICRSIRFAIFDKSTQTWLDIDNIFKICYISLLIQITPNKSEKHYINMSEFNIFYLIKAKKKQIAWITVLFVLIGMSVSLIRPLRYTSSLRLLVVQKGTTTSDPYAMSKSNDYLSQLLAKVSYSNLFFNRVLATDTSIDSSYFGDTNQKRIKNWERTIQVKSLKETGIITVEAYQPSRDQAEKIARATALTLMTQNANYHGMGDNVMVKLLDEPITSTYPDQPNLLVNFIISLVAGMAFGIALSYLQPQKNNYQPVAPVDYPAYRETYMPEVPEENYEEVVSQVDPHGQFPWQATIVN